MTLIDHLSFIYGVKNHTIKGEETTCAKNYL